MSHTRQTVAMILATLSLATACRKATLTASPTPASSPAGVVQAVEDLVRVPRAKGAEELASMASRFRTAALSTYHVTTAPLARAAVQQRVIQLVVEHNGIEHGQLSALLKTSVSGGPELCGGASCAMAFGFGAGDVDPLLDSCLDLVTRDARLQAPAAKPTRSVLLGSLSRHPDWLAPADFGAALTPRKAYDLAAEFQTFKSCASCRISDDPTTIREMIAGARQGDHFVWALRPTGELVVGRGPDELMSHGVLASINLTDVARSPKETLSVLAAGEGYLDPSLGILKLNNKSGHFRPEFSRVANPSITRLFGRLSPAKIEFVDQTKPRTTGG